jgi:hypothetical protein
MNKRSAGSGLHSASPFFMFYLLAAPMSDVKQLFSFFRFLVKSSLPVDFVMLIASESGKTIRIRIRENNTDPDPQHCLEQYQTKKLSSNIPNAVSNHEKTNNQSTTQI